jgi:hypothetical protein
MSFRKFSPLVLCLVVPFSGCGGAEVEQTEDAVGDTASDTSTDTSPDTGDTGDTEDGAADIAVDANNDDSPSDVVGDDEASDESGDVSPDSDTDDSGDTTDVLDAADSAELADVDDVFPPDNHVAVSFRIDDSANRTYGPDDGLAWKGSFSFDSESRVLSFDGSWRGPYPMLWDDGPWDAGGHEPSDATAGDSVWGVTVWVASPEETINFEYGAIRGSVGGGDGEWIWNGPNGAFSVVAEASDPIEASGLLIDVFGEYDLKLTIDVSASGANLTPSFQGTDYTSVSVKGSAWSWAEVAMRDDGTGGDDVADDKVYTFRLSDALGPFDGLLRVGDQADFVFVLDGVEYRDGEVAASAGVAAYSIHTEPDAWSPESVSTSPAGNLRVTIVSGAE